MAEAVAEWVREVPGAEVVLRRRLNSQKQMRSSLEYPPVLDATGGQESTILSFHTTLLHHGMVIVGYPTVQPQSSVEQVPACLAPMNSLARSSKVSM